MSDKRGSGSVVITGATDGLGKAAALLLAERGYRVFAAGRSPEKRAQLDALARERRLPLESVELDVCDENSVHSAVNHVLANVGAIDVLINNAGIGYMGTNRRLAPPIRNQCIRRLACDPGCVAVHARTPARPHPDDEFRGWPGDGSGARRLQRQ